MDVEALRELGLTENEIKIYLHLLSKGKQTAYDISKSTGIYRVHVYDKLEQLMGRGLVSFVLRGSKKYFAAANPDKLLHYLEEQKSELLRREEKVKRLLPELSRLQQLPREDTFVEVFQGPEGIKYFLKDTISVAKEVLITDLDDRHYNEILPHFMPQYFRDLKLKGIRERIIVPAGRDIFLYSKEIAPTSTYRELDSEHFNPTHTFVYGDRVVIVTWGVPVTAVMIKNSGVAKTYRGHFEHLWKIAKEKK